MLYERFDLTLIFICVFIFLYICVCLYYAFYWKDIRLAIYGCGPIVTISSVYLIYLFKGFEINWNLHSLFCLHVVFGLFLWFDRIQTIKRLYAFKSHHQAILDNAADGIVIIETSGKIVLANPSVNHLFGYAETELLHKNIKILMPEEIASQHDSYIADFNRTRIPKFLGTGREVTGMKKNGSLFPLYVAINEIIIREKQYFIGSMHDLTEIKKKENELKYEQNFISKILDTAGALIIVMDHTGQIINFNKASQKLTGYSLAEAQSQKIWENLLPEYEAGLFKNLMPGSKNEKFPANFKTKILTKNNGARLIQWSNTTLMKPDNKIEFIIAIGVDITEQNRQEKELEYLSRRIIQIRDEERSRIAADIHDGLGQILIGLKFLIYDLLFKLKFKPDLELIAKEALNQIDLAVREGRSISHNLSPLALQKIGIPLAIKDLLQNHPQVYSVVDMHAEHIMRVFPDCWNIDLYRLIQEAIVNVIKHASARKLGIQSDIVDNHLVITINDDGIGFNASITRVEEGIGILLMKARANYIGGNLQVNSIEGKGTEIKIVIECP